LFEETNILAIDSSMHYQIAPFQFQILIPLNIKLKANGLKLIELWHYPTFFFYLRIIVRKYVHILETNKMYMFKCFQYSSY